MKKLLAVLLVLSLAFGLSGCCCIPNTEKEDDEVHGIEQIVEQEDTSEKEETTQTETQSSEIIIESSQVETSEPIESVPDINPTSYTMQDYHGMTIADIARIWGSDYTLGEALIAGGWAFIYYDDGRCPFVFCYESYEIPTSCDENMLLDGVIAYPTANDAQFYVANGISVVVSYSDISQEIPGEYYYNEMDGGFSFNCEIAQNIRTHFTWTDNDSVPMEVSVSFIY